MKTLPEILFTWFGSGNELHTKDDYKEAQEAIAKELMGIIGEDEALHDFSPKTHKHYFENLDMETRNQLRAEVRARLTAFIGKGE